MSARCRSPGGHTLLELLIALGLAGTVLAALAVARFGPASGGPDGSAGASREETAFQSQLRSLVVEVQEGTRLVYPLQGRSATDGFGFVDARGETILYRFEASEAGLPGTVYRVNVNKRRREGSRGTPGDPWMESVRTFTANVAPAAPGKEASMLTLEVVQVVPRGPGLEDHVIPELTSIFIRNLERRVPDDLFPEGTPLQLTP